MKNLLLSLGSITLALALATPSIAGATQPLEEFITGAKGHAYDAREQGAAKDQRDWEKAAALGRLLPSFTARGVYTRNQYRVAIPAGSFGPGSPEAVIQKYDGLTALLQLDVPLVDLANYYRYKQAKHMAEAQEAQMSLTQNDLTRGVARSYYNFLGASALVESAERALKIANENFEYVSTRRGAGVATDLDLERARANVELSKQNIADAELARSLSARSLETLTGLKPEPANAFPQDDLQGEGDLNAWLNAKDTPTDQLNAKIQEAAVAGKRAAAFSLAPTLSANAQEQFTNQVGFVGRNNYYLLQVVLSWRLDYAVYAQAQAQAAANNMQVIRNERSRRLLEDTIFEAYRRVEAGIAKSKAARAQATAAKKAADLASERYQAGASTQLDVTQAQKEAFSAEANRIQADADLASSRISLRVAAGKALSLAHSSSALPAEAPPPPPPAPASDSAAQPAPSDTAR